MLKIELQYNYVPNKNFKIITKANNKNTDFFNSKTYKSNGNRKKTLLKVKYSNRGVN